VSPPILGTQTESNVRFLFAEDGPFPGEEIVPTLHKLVELTASVLEAFKALCVAEGIEVDPEGSPILFIRSALILRSQRWRRTNHHR
jgi:hypothetical protein